MSVHLCMCDAAMHENLQDNGEVKLSPGVEQTMLNTMKCLLRLLYTEKNAFQLVWFANFKYTTLEQVT